MPPTFPFLALLARSCEPVVLSWCQMEESEGECGGENTPEAPTPFPGWGRPEGGGGRSPKHGDTAP